MQLPIPDVSLCARSADWDLLETEYNQDHRESLPPGPPAVSCKVTPVLQTWLCLAQGKQPSPHPTPQELPGLPASAPSPATLTTLPRQQHLCPPSTDLPPGHGTCCSRCLACFSHTHPLLAPSIHSTLARMSYRSDPLTSTNSAWHAQVLSKPQIHGRTSRPPRALHGPPIRTITLAAGLPSSATKHRTLAQI